MEGGRLRSAVANVRHADKFQPPDREKEAKGTPPALVVKRVSQKTEQKNEI